MRIAMPNYIAIKISQRCNPVITLAFTLLMLVALTLPVSMANAQDVARQNKIDTHDTRASYTACLTAAAGVTSEMKRCMGSEYAYQDKRLNKAYRLLMAALGKSQRIKLRSDERAWIVYRDSHCALDPNGGQGAELDAYDCSVQETAKQASALEDRLRKEH